MWDNDNFFFVVFKKNRNFNLFPFGPNFLSEKESSLPNLETNNRDQVIPKLLVIFQTFGTLFPIPGILIPYSFYASSSHLTVFFF